MSYYIKVSTLGSGGKCIIIALCEFHRIAAEIFVYIFKRTAKTGIKGK